jgi:CMP-2-keto-3-deoxyoctulosonic acid synthetase
MNKKVVVVVPARMASSRYPGKPLAKILDLPMIEHVRRRALLAQGVDDVVVATCDHEIVDVVERADNSGASMTRVTLPLRWICLRRCIVNRPAAALRLPRNAGDRRQAS